MGIEENPWKLDFDTLAEHHTSYDTTRLIGAKTDPTTGSYPTSTVPSDIILLRQLGFVSVDEDHYDDHPRRRRRTKEQPADLIGAISPDPGDGHPQASSRLLPRAYHASHLVPAYYA
jgi:hypothetical protein